MNLVDRGKGILKNPRQEWPAIDAEPLDVGELLTKYVLPLAAIGPIATVIGMTVFGIGGFRLSVGAALGMAITSYIFSILGIFVTAWIAHALAPTFGATPSMPQAIKLCAYSMTAAWIAGVLGLIPALAILSVVGGLYSLYTLYLGVPVMMKAPQDKALTYTIVIIVVTVVAYVVAGMVTRAVAT